MAVTTVHVKKDQCTIFRSLYQLIVKSIRILTDCPNGPNFFVIDFEDGHPAIISLQENFNFYGYNLGQYNLQSQTFHEVRRGVYRLVPNENKAQTPIQFMEELKNSSQDNTRRLAPETIGSIFDNLTLATGVKYAMGFAKRGDNSLGSYFADMDSNPYNLLNHAKDTLGVNTAMSLLSSAFSATGFHHEDLKMPSCNLNFCGDTKHWIVIKGQKDNLDRFYSYFRKLEKEYLHKGDLMMKKKNTLISCQILDEEGISYELIEQKFKQMVVTLFGAPHCVINGGMSAAIAFNIFPFDVFPDVIQFEEEKRKIPPVFRESSRHYKSLSLAHNAIQWCDQTLRAAKSHVGNLSKTQYCELASQVIIDTYGKLNSRQWSLFDETYGGTLGIESYSEFVKSKIKADHLESGSCNYIISKPIKKRRPERNQTPVDDVKPSVDSCPTMESHERKEETCHDLVSRIGQEEPILDSDPLSQAEPENSTDPCPTMESHEQKEETCQDLVSRIGQEEPILDSDPLSQAEPENSTDPCPTMESHEQKEETCQDLVSRIGQEEPILDSDPLSQAEPENSTDPCPTMESHEQKEETCQDLGSRIRQEEPIKLDSREKLTRREKRKEKSDRKKVRNSAIKGRRFKCIKCSDHFKKKDHVERHFLVKHSILMNQSNEFKCQEPFCKEIITFSRDDNVMKHYRNKHPERINDDDIKLLHSRQLEHFKSLRREEKKDKDLFTIINI